VFARIDNLFDRRHVGSVIVNEANGRYFEPAEGRAWTVGVVIGDW
jgi:iron complex outermembrane receptor protein